MGGGFVLTNWVTNLIGYIFFFKFVDPTGKKQYSRPVIFSL